MRKIACWFLMAIFSFNAISGCVATSAVRSAGKKVENIRDRNAVVKNRGDEYIIKYVSSLGKESYRKEISRSEKYVLIDIKSSRHEIIDDLPNWYDSEEEVLLINSASGDARFIERKYSPANIAVFVHPSRNSSSFAFSIYNPSNKKVIIYDGYRVYSEPWASWVRAIGAIPALAVDILFLPVHLGILIYALQDYGKD